MLNITSGIGRVAVPSLAGKITLVSIALLAMAFAPQAHADIPIIAGHVVGGGEAEMASQVLALANRQVDGVKIEYNPNTNADYNEAFERFDKGEHLADLVFLYVGHTAQLEEIRELAQRGMLLALDEVPDAEATLKTSDLYANLLAPARVNGHLWAVPIRPCPPCMTVNTGDSVPDSWDALTTAALEGGLQFSLYSDPYMYWLSLIAQLGGSLVSDGRYLTPSPVALNALEDIRTLFFTGTHNECPECRVRLLLPNDFLNRPALVSQVQAHPLPKEGQGQTFIGERSWYVGIGSHVQGPVREACLRMIAALLSPEIQSVITQRTFSPPARPSIAASREFQEAFGPGSPQAAFAAMTPRLVFRTAEPGMAEAEVILQSAVETSLTADTEAAASALKSGVSQANAILDAHKAQP